MDWFDVLEPHAETLQVAAAILFGGGHHRWRFHRFDGIVQPWIGDLDRLLWSNLVVLRCH